MSKIPLLKRSTNSINSKSAKKDYIEISKCSKDFQNIYEKYRKTQTKHIVLPNIVTLIQDYRTEKLNALTDTEIVKEEIGGEVKRIKETMLTSKYRNPNAKDKETKRKESRISFLVTLDKFEKQGKLTFNPLPTQSKGKKKFKEFNLNFLYQGGYYKNNIKKKIRLKKRNTINTNVLSVHDKIDTLADGIEYDSKNLKKVYKKNIAAFQNEFNDWKQMQEFINPEIKARRSSLTEY